MYCVNGKEMSYVDEIKAIMNGSLDCADDMLREHVIFMKRTIVGKQNFINEIESENVTAPTMLEIANNMKEKITLYNSFIEWAEARRNIIVA